MTPEQLFIENNPIDIERTARLFADIAYVKDGIPAPMDICLSPLHLDQQMQRFRLVQSLLPELKNHISKVQAHNLITDKEIVSLPPAFRDLHEQLASQSRLPLFCRLDCASLTTNPDNLFLPPAVEFQFRIGGLGFHSAIDMAISGSNHLPKKYAHAVKSTFLSQWSDSQPQIAITVPEAKSREVKFWAGELEKFGLKTEVVTFSSPEQCLTNLLKAIQKGSKLIFRRELNFPALAQFPELGRELAQLALSGEVLFEPPLPLFFDGKALSLTLTGLDKSIPLKNLTAESSLVADINTADFLLAHHKGFLKLCSGSDLSRSFGGHEVHSLDKLSTSQRNQLSSQIVRDLSHGLLWMWQPDLGASKESVEIFSSQNLTPHPVVGRIRSMFFTSLVTSEIIGSGFNITDSSRIVRGGHAIGTIPIT